MNSDNNNNYTKIKLFRLNKYKTIVATTPINKVNFKLVSIPW